MIRSVPIRRRPHREPLPGLHPVVGRVLAQRGLERAPDHSLAGLLAPTLDNLERAAALLADAVENGRRIVVVGDFDADGATGTAVAVRGLRGLGAADVRWRMPDRQRHGYGLGTELAGECLALDPDVLVTVDHGITSVDGVRRVREAGVQVVVTDHHLPGPELPEADAIVNPNLPGDPFGSRHPAGVGVIFYVVAAVRAELRRRGRQTDYRLDGLLDLVALGTVADLVRLDENNRRLVWQGIRRIRARRCQPGVAALLEVAGRNLAHVTAADLGFTAGPRLNAAGRLDDISIGLRCLLTDDEREARELAAELDRFNRQRQTLQSEMVEAAAEMAQAAREKLEGEVDGLCLHDESWHPGVVGLVASRLCEQLQRPVVACAPAEPGSRELKGSARSPQGVHMRDLLAAVDAAAPGIIDRFGGHARAAGLSLDRDRIEAFRDAFEAQAGALEFAPPDVLTDGELSGEEMVLESALALADAGPWGQGWDEPLFDGRFRVLERRVVGEHHLKLRLRPVGDGPAVDAIAFRAGEWCHRDLPDPLGITYRLAVNRFRGEVGLQLMVQHFVRETAS
ncbi:MAG: single-stranded-DNA-specific exonuclease RecJ [Wenzhouxiangellaceae bacterium]|nr:single-stranded-DNA-specific exonuclease RecJ [Wenzhouxiangellaceae bacterium]